MKDVGEPLFVAKERFPHAPSEKAIGKKGDKRKSACFSANKRSFILRRGKLTFYFPPSRSAFSERREETVLEHRRRGPRIIIFAGGEISSFFIFRIYPIGFLGGGAWEPLFGLPESGSPAIYLFLLSSSIPWGRRGIGWAPADRRSHTRRGRPAGWAGG